jgi:hypothetical protein
MGAAAFARMRAMFSRIPIAIVLLAACASSDAPVPNAKADVGAKKKVEVEKKKAVEVEKKIVEVVKEPEPAPTTAVKPPEPEPEPEPAEGDEFPLLREETFGALKVGMNVADLQAAVPGIKAKGKCESSEATGDATRVMLDKKAGVEAGVTCEGAKNLEVQWLKITAPSELESERGIAIGDSADEVKKLYGDVLSEEAEPTEESIIAGSIYGGLGFTFADAKVTEMFLGAMAE